MYPLCHQVINYICCKRIPESFHIKYSPTSDRLALGILLLCQLKVEVATNCKLMLPAALGFAPVALPDWQRISVKTQISCSSVFYT